MLRPLMFLLVALALLLLISAGLPALVSLLADWYWFQALGYSRVFGTELLAKLALGASAAVLAFVFFVVNLRFALRGVAPDAVVLRIRGAQPHIDITRYFRWMVWPVSALLAFAAAGAASAEWLNVLKWLHAVPFGETDAVYGRDIGYYVFTLPVLSDALNLVIGWLVLTTLLVGLVYLLRRDVIVMRRRVTIERAAEGHLALLLAVIFVLIAVHAVFVDLPDLLYSTTGPLTGAS